MVIQNILIYGEDEVFHPGSLRVVNGFIEEICLNESNSNLDVTEEERIIDGNGCYCFPGMIDLHFHGCKGYDVCDGSREALEEISRYEASIGVTAIAPATMTLPVEELENILRNMADYKNAQLQGTTEVGADFVGINMEGPFISTIKKGAQDENNIIAFDIDVYHKFQEASNGLVKFIGIAPEMGDAQSFIEKVKDEVSVALAHTNANYETAKKAFDAGANHVVHLYNAMPAFTHREPGVIGAVADSSWVLAELICDGVHIHPAAVRTTFSMLGKDRIVLISDSMRATGMPEGRYTLGGLEVDVHTNRATLVNNGALAGSVTTLPDCVRNIVKEMGIPLEIAIACATSNPAKSLRIDDQYGSIAVGRKADLVLWNHNLDLVLVIKDGEELNPTMSAQRN